MKNIDPVGKGNVPKLHTTKESRSKVEMERIIFTGDRNKIEKLLKELKAGLVIEDLGNGFVLAEVKKDSLPNIYKSLPEGMNAFKDQKVGLVEPEELKNLRNLEKMKNKVEKR
ncbi:MAG: hypothetical protein ACK4GR_03420, partial [bacterium]